METLQHGMQAAFSGALSLLPLIYRYATTMPFGKALRNISLLCCAFGLGTVMLKHAALFKREYDYQTIITLQAELKNHSCHKIDDILRYDPGVDETCTEAQRIVSTWPIERAFSKTVSSWMTPWDIGAYLLVSMENKITTLGFAAYIAATLLPYIIGPPVQFLQGRHVANKINSLQGAYT